VLGSSSGQARAVRAAQLLERGFGSGLSWLRPSMGTVDSLAPIDASPPNLRDEMCNGKRKRPASDEDDSSVTLAGSSSTGETAVTFFAAGLQAPMPKASEVLLQDVPVGQPMVVYTGPKKQGAALIAAVATDSEKQTTRRGKRSRVAAKPDAAAEAKPAAAKPAAAKPKVQHAAAKPEAAAAKPAAPAATATPKPPAAKPAAAAKPKPKPENNKPAT
jgi:D-alanyl-D-alanine carboxypeptidase